MDIDYKQKKNKYQEKIDKEQTLITFTPDTIKIINSSINFWSFLKKVLKADDISHGCNINNELQIIIKVGDTIHIFAPNNRTLVTHNDINMIIETIHLIDSIKKGTTELDLSDETIYNGLLTNNVILGYIFLLNLNKKIKFKHINVLNPFAKKIVQMVLDANNVVLPTNEINEDDIEEDDSPSKC